MTKNIDDFNRFTACLLDALYEAFPQQLDSVSYSDFFQDQDKNAIKNFDGTMRFLLDEGFIRCDKLYVREESTAIDMRLSSKGLATLKLIPDAISDDKATLSDKIKAATKDGGKQSLNAVITQTIAAFVRLHLG